MKFGLVCAMVMNLFFIVIFTYLLRCAARTHSNIDKQMRSAMTAVVIAFSVGFIMNLLILILISNQ